MSISKPKVLLFIVAYSAERMIEKVVKRIPSELSENYKVDILIIDDCSIDKTFEKSINISKAGKLPFNVKVLFNPLNQGYGENQKIGYLYAIKFRYDFVAIVHADSQYAPELLPSLLRPLYVGNADVVFGSRMLTHISALRRGMPFYKFLGNKILTWIENKLLSTNLSKFLSGYRIYSVNALRSIPFEKNSNDFHFDTEIIIQFLIARQKIVELPIPTYYGNQTFYPKGLNYAFNVILSVCKARLQEMSLFYDSKFDCDPLESFSPYTLKMSFNSPHSLAFDRIPKFSKVLDIGCADGSFSKILEIKKNCYVVGLDKVAYKMKKIDCLFIHDLDTNFPEIPIEKFDYILLLDFIEHLSNPEQFLEKLRYFSSMNPKLEIFISTPNVAYFITRLMLLLGQFNYGKRGILDKTHKILYTFSSIKKTINQSGFKILETKAIPAPFPLAVGDNSLGRFLLLINQTLILLSKSLFSYQLFFRVKPLPTIEKLLADAEKIVSSD